jgi:beta-phosphoglucomutase-like phosphatase (HAD superfamily)
MDAVIFDMGRPVDAAGFARWTRDKWGRMAERAPGRIVPMDGALELVALLGARGVPIAVASSSPMSFIGQVLSELGVGDAVAEPERILGLG